MKAISLKRPDRSWIVALILIAVIGLVVRWIGQSPVDIGAAAPPSVSTR